MSIANFLLSHREQRLLAPLLLLPDKSFGTLELIKMSGAGRGGGQKALRKLLDAGVALATKMGNQQRIQINQAFPLYPELRSICMKSFGLQESIKEALQPVASDIEEAYVFGSVAQGTDRPDSDIDLMVIGSVDLAKIYHIAHTLEEKIGRTIHVQKYSRQDWETSQSDPIVKRIANDKRIQVI